MVSDDSETASFPDPSPVGDDTERFACLQLLTGNSAGLVFKMLPGEATVGRSQGADLTLDDRSISRIHARLCLDEVGACHVIDLDSRNGTYVNNKRIASSVLHDGDKVRFGTHVIAKFAWQDPVEEHLQTRLYETATRDPLTGATARASFLQRYTEEMGLAREGQAPLSLLMMDIDHFKRINDTYGHLAGDQVLRDVVGCIGRQLRREDQVARYGGEEFVLSVHLDLLEAAQLGERIRAAVAASPFRVVVGEEAHDISVSISVGVASTSCGAEDLLQAADEALYVAKSAGRNRVEVKGA